MLTGRHTASGRNSGLTTAGPRQILAERYARGEIDDDEYHRRLATLTGDGVPPPHTATHR